MGHFRPMNWIQWLTLLLAFTTAAVVPILFIRVDNQQAASVNALRTVLCLAESNVQTVKGISPHQRHVAEQFYAQALSDIGAQPCSQGAHA